MMCPITAFILLAATWSPAAETQFTFTKRFHNKRACQKNNSIYQISSTRGIVQEPQVVKEVLSVRRMQQGKWSLLAG